MPITIYPGSMKKRNANGSYSDLVPAIATDPEVLDDFAEEYSTSETYNIGDYCIHNSDLYKCNTNNTTGTWNNNAWDRVTVADELVEHKNTLMQDESSLAYPISGDTNTTGAQINKGVFVRLAGNSNPSLPDGYYLVAENIGVGASYSTTNLQKLKKDSGNSNYGALSVLNEHILKRGSLSFGVYSPTGSIAPGTYKNFTATFSKNVPFSECVMLGHVGAAQPLLVSCYPGDTTSWGINIYNAGSVADGGALRVVLLSLVEDVTITISERN